MKFFLFPTGSSWVRNQSAKPIEQNCFKNINNFEEQSLFYQQPVALLGYATLFVCYDLNCVPQIHALKS